ncbi:hypothetical protein NPIL_588611, partial [Nephila pilipes]
MNRRWWITNPIYPGVMDDCDPSTSCGTIKALSLISRAQVLYLRSYLIEESSDEEPTQTETEMADEQPLHTSTEIEDVEKMHTSSEMANEEGMPTSAEMANEESMPTSTEMEDVEPMK